jgi:hypothetical protein
MHHDWNSYLIRYSFGTLLFSLSIYTSIILLINSLCFLFCLYIYYYISVLVKTVRFWIKTCDYFLEFLSIILFSEQLLLLLLIKSLLNSPICISLTDMCYSTKKLNEKRTMTYYFNITYMYACGLNPLITQWKHV